jgi:ceramide glucosyltransferase
MPSYHSLLGIIGFGSLAIAASYAVLALVAVLVWQSRIVTKHSLPLPPVTILKPLCGAEPGLYHNLRSFCQQDYPEFQIVFGVRDLADPALLVVERLAAEFPCISIDIVVNPEQHGSNRKVSSLINMLARARYDVLAMADSDVFAEPDYLATVTAPLTDRNVGLVTCIYRDAPTQRIWSRLGAMYINEWYMPSVLVAWLFGHRAYASGQTLCLRRDTLALIGGLAATANHLADDYQLGELVRGCGLRIVLSPYVLKAEHHEPNVDSLVRHELRWMRTIRMLRPRSFCFIFLTFSLPLAIVGIALSAADRPVSTAAWGLFVATLLARLALHLVHRLGGDRAVLSDFWLLPARDLLLTWVWSQSFFASRITWSGGEFDVAADGTMRTPS